VPAVLKAIIGVFAVILAILLIGAAVRVANLPESSVSAVPDSSIPKTPLTEAQMVVLRQEYAKVIDKQLLESGIESTTTTSGTKATILVINDPLAGRVREHTLSSNGKLFEQLRALHFQKLRYTNGFDETFVWDLTK
jgi:hypothetical protein